MGTVFIKTSRKTKTEMDGPSGRGLKEDESAKLEREVQRYKIVERNRRAGQNPPRVVAQSEEERSIIIFTSSLRTLNAKLVLC
jgi:hypothetical protein